MKASRLSAHPSTLTLCEFCYVVFGEKTFVYQHSWSIAVTGYVADVAINWHHAVKSFLRSSSVSKEILCFLWKRKVPNRVRQIAALVPTFSQLKSSAGIPNLFTIHLMLYYHLPLDLPSGFFPSYFLTKSWMHSLLPIDATRSSYLNLRDMVSLIFSEEYITGSSSICNFLLWTNIFSSNLFSNIRSLGFDIQ